jgi:hypothetical protein
LPNSLSSGGVHFSKPNLLLSGSAVRVIWPGAVARETFDIAMARLIERYFGPDV